MTINLDPYQVFMIAVISLGAFVGLAKLIAKQAIESINEKLEAFKEIKDSIKELNQTVNNTERDLLTIKLDIAQQYVRKDDFIRLEKHITDELKALSEKIDTLKEARKP
jgi:hypothetical protein